MRKMYRSLAALLLAAAVMMTCAAALAVDGVPYLDAAGVERKANGVVEINESHLPETWTGWYVVTETVAIPNRITVSGEVHLILADNATLTASKGITVEDDDNNPDTKCPNSLTIYAQSAGENAGG